MSERSVDLSFLQKAVARLDAGLTRYRQDIHDEQIRDGLIQRFEFTYEISHETLKRFLKASSASPQEPGLGRAIWRKGRDGAIRSNRGERWRTEAAGVSRDAQGLSWRKGDDGVTRGSDGMRCRTDAAGTLRCNRDPQRVLVR